MFPKGHYEKMFADICSKNDRAKNHIFNHGGHPAMMSNLEAFSSLCNGFFDEIN